MTQQTYTVSIHYDRRLYRQDIAGSVAHARMLAKQGIVPDKDATKIIGGLMSIQTEIAEDRFPWKPELEDIHMNIEARLHELVGPVAGKLHTARSRNDQVSTDLRLYAKEAIENIIAGLRGLQQAVVGVAEANSEAFLPGYTHLQRAQPVLLAHHFMAYFEMLQRDIGRFQDCHGRTDVLPLGSGALAGVPYPIDREFVARELGFGGITANSMDAVSDRDFVVEFLSASALCMAHLSRLAEELVLWSSQEFGYVTMDDAYTTGSSIMPQKRNPDLAELARGKTGRVYGNLVAMLTILKGLPLTYNRDMQEDKEPLFDTVDTLHATLEAFQGMVSTMKVNTDRMGATVDEESLLLATDLADYLVAKGLPFREAHGVVAKLSRHVTDNGTSLDSLSLDEYKTFSEVFDQGVYEITPQSSMKARDVPGGTAPQQVAAALAEAKRLLGEKP
ncbi:MAG: argininosuccinate lyase [Chloroflexi bacterium]|jgi:argininosuccinate lyase|nr:MAG: argininosuccinate lyase [Chloroflexota bacterium]